MEVWGRQGPPMEIDCCEKVWGGRLVVKSKEVEGAYEITFWKGITEKWDRFERGINLIPGDVPLFHSSTTSRFSLFDIARCRRFPEIYGFVLTRNA